MNTGYPPYQSPNPPTKANLRAWLKHFNFAQRLKKEAIPPKIFGVPLRDSLRIANVPISTANVSGELFVWGYVPVVVAKCGLYLKERATEVEGTFRINGSNKRMRDLQALFETPPKFGKNVDWANEPYTVHDVASVFRRYLTQMPESVIPTAFYHQFRDVLAKKPFSQEEAIASCKRLIRSMPRANQYLLLYVLDLLSVFARKSDINFMTAANLAVIFRPAILSLPEHEMAPKEHELSQRVIEFLIEHQDWFMSDMPPPPRQDSILANKTNTTQTSGAEDIYVMPSDTDEDHPENGWKLIEKEKSLSRRRTIADAPALTSVSILEGHKLTAEPATLSAIPSDPEGQDDQVLGLGVAGVKRSATTPSRKGVELEPRILTKKRFGLGQNGRASPK